MKHFIRFKLMIKRTLKQPFFYIMAAVLVMLAILSRIIPESEKSTSIPVAVLCLDTSEDASDTVSDILTMNSIFDYYTVSSSDEMYHDIASGKADSGFIIPEDYYAGCTSYSTLQDIRIIVTDGSTFPSLAADEIYSVIFRYSAARILRDTIETEEIYGEYSDKYTTDEIADFTLENYDQIISGDGIFHVEDISGGKYNELSIKQSVELPVKKLSAFFILTAALIGLLNFMNDKEYRLFIRMSGFGQFFMKLFEILALMLPVSIISYIAILVACPDEKPILLLMHMLAYLLIVCLFSFVIGLIIRKSTLLKGVLPVYLILTLIFGGIFIDLSGFNALIRIISGFFPTFYF